MSLSLTEKLNAWWQDHPEELVQKKTEFCQALRENGVVRYAAERAGIHRRTAYHWRAVDEEFRANWNDALQHAVDAVESRLYTEALNGNVIPMLFYLKGHRAIYRDRLSIDVGAVQAEIEERLGQLDARELLLTAGDENLRDNVAHQLPAATDSPVV